MRDSIIKFAIFAAGVIIGSAVTWKYAKDKYAKIADEEIASVKEVYAKKKKPEEKPADDPRAKLMGDYTDRLQQYGYLNDEEHPKEEGGSDVKEKPYVISPDEFDEMPDYEKVSYVLYADNVLTDEFDEIVEDVEGTVGEESLTHFGEYEDDSVFVRNDELKTDFEILADLRRYSDIYPDRSGEE